MAIIVYLAGRMTGLPEYNYPAFNDAEKLWTANGWVVLNPARRFGGRTDLPYEVYINHSLIDVMATDVVAVLPGWERSKGAQLEVQYARVVGKPIVRAEYPARSLGYCVWAEGQGVWSSS